MRFGSLGHRALGTWVSGTGNHEQKNGNRIGIWDLDRICAGKEHVTENYQSESFGKTHFKLFWPLLFFPVLLGREVAGTVTLKQIYEIAKIKKQDSSMKNVPMESLCKIIIGSTRSMGIGVVPGRDQDTWHKTYCVRFLQRCSLDCHAIFTLGLSRNRIFRIVTQYFRKDIIEARSFLSINMQHFRKDSVPCQKRLTVPQTQWNALLDHLVGPRVRQERDTSFKEDVKEYAIDRVRNRISSQI